MTIKGVVTLQLDHFSIDLALGSYPTTTKKIKSTLLCHILQPKKID